MYFICPTESYLHIKGTVIPKQFELRYVMMTDVLHCPRTFCPRSNTYWLLPQRLEFRIFMNFRSSFYLDLSADPCRGMKEMEYLDVSTTARNPSVCLFVCSSRLYASGMVFIVVSNIPRFSKPIPDSVI